MKILFSENFLKEAKSLSTKYKLLKSDLQEALQEIEISKDFGVNLGARLFKKRLKNSSIPTGKSGGFRVIIYEEQEENIVLISIFSKTDRENLSDEELTTLLQKYLLHLPQM